MIVITVTRKPLNGTVASNALKWGTGGIDIDSSRIGHTEDFSNIKSRAAMKLNTSGKTHNPDASSVIEAQMKLKNLDRWPANMILTHLDGCCYTGTTTVKTQTHYPASRGVGGLGTSGHSGQTDLAEVSPGSDVVDAWDCVPGCPVDALDKQSGSLYTRGNINAEPTEGGMFGHPEFVRNRPLSYDRESGLKGGGASRFFKVVQRNK